MSQPTALITGANKGIGFEIARQLGEKGFHLFLAVRNMDRGQQALERLNMPNAELVEMDASNLASIGSAFGAVQSKTKQLDVLINNAAVMLPEDKDILSASPELVMQHIGTNSLGPLYIVQTFLPLLQRGSRVVNISSEGGQICSGEMATWSPLYCVSKTLLNALTLQLSAALQGRGVVVNAVCPGWVQTDMGGSGAPRSVQQGADTPVWLASEAPLSVNGKFLRDRAEIPW